MSLLDLFILFEAGPERIDRAAAALFVAAIDDLTRYTQSIEHVVTGNMRDTTHRLGPFPVGPGLLEATIESGAWYAELVVDRGGDADWASRAAKEQERRTVVADHIAERAAQILTGAT